MPVEIGVRLRILSSRAPVVVTALSAPVGSSSLIKTATSLSDMCGASVSTMRLGGSAHTSMSPAGANSAMGLMFGAMVHVRLRSNKLSAAVSARLLLLATRVR